MKLLTFNNAKTVKGEHYGYRTAIMYLAPSDASGVTNTCKWATRECRSLCLYNSGHSLVFKSVNKARIERTKFMHKNYPMFLEQLANEIENHLVYCKKHKVIPCVRLNGTSDIYDEGFEAIINNFPEIQFYDYSKDFNRVMRFLDEGMPDNYHLTYSHSEGRLEKSKAILQHGGNVAVVFAVKRKENLPLTWQGFKVADGDINDLRFRNKSPYVIGLRSKGHATKAKAKQGAFINPNQNT